MRYFMIILESLLLAFSVSIDNFVADVAYGSNNIKVPFLSMQVINLVGSAFFGVALLAGSFLRSWLPAGLTVGICFAVLLNFVDLNYRYSIIVNGLNYR